MPTIQKKQKPYKKFNTLKVAILKPLAINQTPVASARHQKHSDFITKRSNKNMLPRPISDF